MGARCAAWDVTYRWTDGTVYEGQIRNGKRTGKGKYVYGHGDVYEGEFEEDKMHGFGKYTNADGSVWHDGMWKDHKPVDPKASGMVRKKSFYP